MNKKKGQRRAVSCPKNGHAATRTGLDCGTSCALPVPHPGPAADGQRERRNPSPPVHVPRSRWLKADGQTCLLCNKTMQSDQHGGHSLPKPRLSHVNDTHIHFQEGHLYFIDAAVDISVAGVIGQHAKAYSQFCGILLCSGSLCDPSVLAVSCLLVFSVFLQKQSSAEWRSNSLIKFWKRKPSR